MKSVFLIALTFATNVYAEYSAEIIFPDGEKKVYVLKDKQDLPDLRIGWTCSFSIKETKEKDLVFMNLICSPKGQTNKDVFVYSRCIENIFGSGKRGAMSNPLMLGDGQKTTDIALSCD